MENDDYFPDGIAAVMMSVQQTELIAIEKAREEERRAWAALRAQQEHPGLTVNELLGLQARAQEEVMGVETPEAAQALAEDEKRKAALAFQKVGRFPPPPTGKG